MSIDLANSIKSSSNWAFKSIIPTGVLSSSITVAVLVSVVMVTLIALFYPAKRGTSFFILVKLFVYMFISSMVIVFLHDSVVKSIRDDEQENKNMTDMMNGLTTGGRSAVYRGGNTLVTPSNLDTSAIAGGCVGSGVVAGNGVDSGVDGGVDGGVDSGVADSSSSSDSECYVETKKVTFGGCEILGGKPPKAQPNIFA